MECNYGDRQILPYSTTKDHLNSVLTYILGEALEVSGLRRDLFNPREWKISTYIGVVWSRRSLFAWKVTALYVTELTVFYIALKFSLIGKFIPVLSSWLTNVISLQIPLFYLLVHFYFSILSNSTHLP